MLDVLCFLTTWIAIILPTIIFDWPFDNKSLVAGLSKYWPMGFYSEQNCQTEAHEPLLDWASGRKAPVLLFLYSYTILPGQKSWPLTLHMQRLSARSPNCTLFFSAFYPMWCIQPMHIFITAVSYDDLIFLPWNYTELLMLLLFAWDSNISVRWLPSLPRSTQCSSSLGGRKFPFCSISLSPNTHLFTNSLSVSHGNWCTGTLLNRIITAQWEGMGDVGSARYELALLPPCPTISYSNCQEIHPLHF